MRCAIAKTYGEMAIAQWRTARLALTTRVTELSEHGKASRRKWHPSCHALIVVFVVRRSPWLIVLCRAIKPIERGGDPDSLRSIGT